MAKCVGCGLEVNNGILEIATCANGGLTCTPEGDVNCPDGGLSVVLCPSGGIQKATAASPGPNGCTDGLYVAFPDLVQDPLFPPNPDGTQKPAALGNCLNTDATGKITVDLDDSPTGCNALQCTSEGLFVSCTQTLHGISQANFKAGITAPVPVNTLGLGTFNFEADRNWQICNTGCCNMQAMVIIETGGLAVDMNPGFLGRLTFEQSFDNGATWGGIFPEHVQWLDNRNHVAGNANAGVKRESFNLWHETFWNIIDVGTCFTYTARMHLVVQAGTGSVSNFGSGAGVELHYHAAPVGCAPCKDPGDGPATTPFDTTRNMTYVPR